MLLRTVAFVVTFGLLRSVSTVMARKTLAGAWTSATDNGAWTGWGFEQKGTRKDPIRMQYCRARV